MIPMRTRHGSVLLIALGLMTACVALAFAFLSASARTLNSAQDESAGMLSRSAARQGTAHAPPRPSVIAYPAPRDIPMQRIASTEASVATELTLAVRNKVVEAFNQIMQMPI